MGHINPATGRNKREGGPQRVRDGKSKGGGIKRWNGQPVERRVDWQRRVRTRGNGA